MEQLSSELKKLVGVQPVGKVWIDFHVPRGGIPFLAQEVSRTLYADLLKYVQDTGQMKTETEWQEMYTAQNGYVPYYSDGDGVNTFRMPSMGSTYPQFASSLDDVRVFVEEGLPNITGIQPLRWNNNLGEAGSQPLGGGGEPGAFYRTFDPTDQTITYTNSNATAGRDICNTLGFDASRSSAIYGNSVHVTPETGKILIGVYAIGVVTDVGSIDTSELLETVEKLNADLDNKVDKTGDTMTGVLNARSGVNFSSYSLTHPPVQDSWGQSAIQFYDANSIRFGFIQPFYRADGIVELRFTVSADGKTYRYLKIYSDGNATWNEKVITTFTTDNKIQFPNGTSFWIE